jgi:hypothetical protein
MRESEGGTVGRGIFRAEDAFEMRFCRNSDMV